MFVLTTLAAAVVAGPIEDASNAYERGSASNKAAPAHGDVGG